MNYFDGFDVRLLVDEDGDWIAHFIELPNFQPVVRHRSNPFESCGLLGVW